MYTPAVNNDAIVSNTFGEYRQRAWKTDLENKQAMGTPAVCWHDPISWLLLQNLRLVLVFEIRSSDINNLSVNKNTLDNLRTAEDRNNECRHLHYQLPRVTTLHLQSEFL